jgi:hypothetical protein
MYGLKKNSVPDEKASDTDFEYPDPSPLQPLCPQLTGRDVDLIEWFESLGFEFSDRYGWSRPEHFEVFVGGPTDFQSAPHPKRIDAIEEVAQQVLNWFLERMTPTELEEFSQAPSCVSPAAIS